MAKPPKAFLTVKYKLHNPSKRRRAMLLDAMRRAHLGYDKLLKTVQPEVEALAAARQERKKDLESYRLLARRLRETARPLPLGNGPKQAIVADALAQAESFVELKRADENTSYPKTQRLRVKETDRAEALERFVNSQTELEENEKRDELMKLSRPGVPRPLNILKNRVSDGALLLQDEKSRLFAFINLLPGGAKRRRAVKFDGLTDTRTGQVMKGKTSGGDLFPLQGSGWHARKFLERGTLQSSRLIFDGEDFYFACTFQYEPEPREPVLYLGVDRGIELLAAWAVVDENCVRADQGQISGERLRLTQRREEQNQKQTQRRGKIYKSKTRRHIADEEVHKAANAIAGAAVRHNARVVIEELKNIAMGPHHARPKGARKGGWRRMLTRAQYMKLKHYVNYRLLAEGFPNRKKSCLMEVKPPYTSITCSACGHCDRANRSSQAVFVCVKCGHKENADVNAAHMIASKGVHFEQVVKGRKKGQKLKESEKFSAWYADLKNGAGACANGP